MYKKILVPTDGSKFAEKAERDALFIANASGAEIIALGVAETNFSIGLPSDDSLFHINKMLRKEAEKNLERFEKMREDLNADIKMTLRVEEGAPADIILDILENEDVDLAVMGSSGKTGFDRFIIGSVAEKVVKSAKTSVLVVY
jgi:nucleotide-binding universal stress UspA family protein